MAKAFLEKAVSWVSHPAKTQWLEYKRNTIMVKVQSQQFKEFRNVHKELIHKYKGPFPIPKKVCEVAYKL